MTSKQVSNSIDKEKKMLSQQADLCQSLTHPFRLKILHILKDGEKDVSDIKLITNRPQPYISQHLRVLRDKGVVITRRRANEVYYTLADPKILQICDLVADLIANKEESPE